MDPGDTTRRIVESSFPGKVMVNGKNVYITLPSAVMERMELKKGDHLDVTVRWPRIEEVEDE